MKAAFFRRGGKFEVMDAPVPETGPGAVLVRVNYCGICGSDLHMVSGGLLPAGCIIGHELSGTVAKTGAGVQGFAEGDRVVVMPLDPCAACEPCQRGDTQLCAQGMTRNYGLGMLPGGFAEFMLTKPSMLFKVPAGLDLQTAAINEPWAVAVHAVNALRLGPDSLVLIMGAGPIGLLTVFALRRAGVKNIYVSEPDPFRAGKAQVAGAAKVLDPRQHKPAVVIPKEAGRPPDVVIDCVGTQTSTQDAAAVAGPKASVIVLGVHLGNIVLTPLICFAKELKFVFSLGYQAQEFRQGLELLAQGALKPEVVISDVMPLSAIGAAFELLKQSGHTKVLIDCQSAG